MRELRDIRVLVGKRTYNVKTSLDDQTLSRLEDIAQEACPKTRRGVEQEHLLMLTCLQLSYDLIKTADALSSLLARLQEPQK